MATHFTRPHQRLTAQWKAPGDLSRAGSRADQPILHIRTDDREGSADHAERRDCVLGPGRTPVTLCDLPGVARAAVLAVPGRWMSPAGTGHARSVLIGVGYVAEEGQLGDASGLYELRPGWCAGGELE